MKTAIVLSLAIVVLPQSFAQAKDKATPAPHAASSGSSASSANQILPPDILVKNVLLPAWRAGFRNEVKSWHKQGSAILDDVSVREDEKQEPFAEATCTADCAEKERAAPLAQDRPHYSTEL